MNSVQKVSTYVIWKIETFTEEDTRNIVHRTMAPQSPSKWAPWDLTQSSQSSSAAPLYFLESHWQSEISSLSKVILVWGEARNGGALNLGCSGGWVTWVIRCFTKKLCRGRDTWVGVLWWWSCQSPVACSCSLLNHLNSLHWGMFKLNAKFDEGLLLYLLSHFECDGHIVHMLITQWCLPPPLTSTVKSSLFTHAHSSPLSLAARLYWCCTNHSHYVNMIGFFWTDLVFCVFRCANVCENKAMLTFFL